MSSRRLALVLAPCAAAMLLAMVAVSLATGATQEAHEHYQPPADYARTLRAHGGLRAMFGLDIAFVVFYTGFFAAFARYLHERQRPFARLAFGALVGVALLDVIEDHHILALLAQAEAGRAIDEGAIVFQDTLSATKFSISYLAFFLYGLALPRTTRLDRALVVFLTVGTLATGVLGIAAPPAWRAALDGGRWIGFLAGFALVFAWLRAAPEARES